MKRILLLLSFLAVGSLVLLFVLFTGRTASERPTTEAPAPAEESPAPILAPDDRLAGETAPAAQSEARTEVDGSGGEQFGEWTGGERWLAGRVLLPAGVPADGTLRVLVLSRALAPEELYGTNGIVPKLAARERESLPAELLSVQPVAADGSFRIPLPADAEGGWLALDGRYLFTQECVELAADDSGTIELVPKVGALVTGHVSLPVDVGDPARTFAVLDVRMGPDANQFSLVDVDGNWLFEHGAKVDGKGDFELRAVDAVRPYELYVFGGDLATYSRDGIVLEAGREYEVDCGLPVGATLRGRVVDESGASVEGAEVAAIKLVMWGFPGQELAEGESGADGTFELTSVPPGKVNVIARADGYLQSTVVELELDDEEIRDGVELVVEEGNVVAGTVRWQDGGAAEGAKIRVQFDPEAMMGVSAFNAARGADGAAETDAEGSFRITGMGHGPFLVTAVMERDAEAPPLKARASAVKKNTEDLELVLMPPSEVRGTVVDPEGNPVSDFAVSANSQGAVFFMPGEHRRQDFSEAGGAFVLHGLEEGLWTIEVRAAGFGPSVPQDVALPQPDLAPLAFVLRPAAGVAGMVLDPDGEPVAGAKVSLQVETNKTFAEIAGRLDLPEAYSAEDGTFRLESLAPGEHAVVAKHPDYATSEIVHVEVEAGRILEEVHLTLRLGGTLTGELYDKEGERLAGAQIFVQDPTTWAMNVLRTEADGTFRVERLRPGTWQVTAMIGAADSLAGTDDEAADMSTFFENMRFTMAQVVEGEETHVVLGAPPEDPVTVHGRVTHAGEPVDAAMVSFLPEGGQGFEAIKMDQVDAEGAYEIQLEEPGRYLVQVQFFGRVGAEQQNIEYSERIPEDERHELDIELPLGRISGTVYGPDRDPLGNARVTLYIEGGVAAGTFLGGQYAELTTEADGRYAFEFLRTGTYTVAAGGAVFGGVFGTSSPHGRVMKSGVRVKEGDSADGIDFRLAESGDLTGVVVDANGGPVSGAAIFVRDENGRLLDRFSMIASSADGTFRYSGLAPGEYTVSARVSELVTPEEKWVRVRESEAASVELVLGGGTTLLVRITDKGGEAVSGARVSVVDGDGREMNGMVAYAEVMAGLGEGFSYDEIQIGPIPPGSYTVTAETDDGRRARKPVTLTGQAERKLKLRLR